MASFSSRLGLHARSMVMASVFAVAALLFGSIGAMATGITPDPTLPAEPLKLTSYEVVPGDTLLGIAQNFGITPETILWANGMSNGDLLRIGQNLTILPVSGVLHQVKPGESVSSIAATYGVDAARIVEANQISDPSLVREGNLLIVPGAVMTSAPASASPGSGSEGTAAVQYAVKPGDTLSSIAAAFGVPVSALQSANSLENSDLLGIGQVLSIPGTSQPVAPQQPAAEAPAQQRETSSRGAPQDGKSFIANVTAYTIQGRTAIGTRTRWGIVAVDPGLIPLGTKIRVDGFEDTFIAEDTGGGVRGKWVDIFFPNYADAIRFGVQSRRVTIVEP